MVLAFLLVRRLVLASDADIHLQNRGGADIHLLNRVSIISGAVASLFLSVVECSMAWLKDALRDIQYKTCVRGRRSRHANVTTMTGGACACARNK